MQIVDYSSSSGSGRFFGTRDSAKVRGFRFATNSGTAQTGSEFYLDFDGKSLRLSSSHIDLNRHIYELEKYGFYIDGSVKYTFGTVSDFTTSYSLIMFGANMAGVISASCGLKVYQCILKERGTFIRNYIPCYRKSDGVIGLYDLCGSICPLTGTPFYTNAGTGAFTKGADVA